jgi:Uma2 family endonuclease
MKTVVVGPRPPELDAVIARRQALQLDRFDEVWKGDYHMAPAPHPWHGYVVLELAGALRNLALARRLLATDAFNLGQLDDYRVPDLGLHRQLPNTPFVATAALIVEVVSPGDESYDKFDFYADHDVDEVLIAEPTTGNLWLFVLEDREYHPAERSAVLDIDIAHIAAVVRWPS